jgi:hypothetical protein
MSKLQKSKRNFRNSKAWKEFRHKMNVLQHGIDPITGAKLAKGCNLHHRHISAGEDDYKDMSNEDDFVMLGSMCHKMLHFLYIYWKKDPSIMDRIEEEFSKWY